MESNPSLWLHLAECCIVATKRNFANEVNNFYSNNNNSNKINNSGDNNNKNNIGDTPVSAKTVLGSIGSGVHRKLVVLKTSKAETSTKTSKGETPTTPDNVDIDNKPTLSLEFAARCLRNALAFCSFPKIGERPAVSRKPEAGNGNSSSANSSAQTSPVKSVSTVDKSLMMRGAILVNSAYVAIW